MDIAIQFEKISVGDGKYIFRPISLIKGNYYNDENEFVSEYGVIYCGLEDAIDDVRNCFSTVTTMESLRKYFGPNLSDEELLYEFYAFHLEQCFIGILDPITNKIKTMRISYDELEDQYDNFTDETNDNNIVAFTTEMLKEIRNSKSLEELRAKIDCVINSTNEEISENVHIKENDLVKDLESIESKENIEEIEDKKLKLSLKKNESLSLKYLRKEVLSRIVNQDNAVNDVTRTILINQTSKNPRHKQHILIMGPSGTGKTRMVDIIAKTMNIPYFQADATAYTKEGYVGKSIYSMFERLIETADGDIEKAQNGILIIDEIDKKLTSSRNDNFDKDVLHSLLKVMDRGTIEVDISDSRGKESVLFDTSNLTIIFMGAFSDLYEKKAKNNSKIIGFDTKPDNDNNKVDESITREDLIKYGVPAEWLGRIGLITFTERLTAKDLVDILNKSKESPLVEEKEWFKDLGVKVTFSKGFKELIAEQTSKTNTGARNLRSLVGEAVKYASEEVLNGNRPKVLKFTKETVKNNKKYYSM